MKYCQYPLKNQQSLENYSSWFHSYLCPLSNRVSERFISLLFCLEHSQNIPDHFTGLIKEIKQHYCYCRVWENSRFPRSSFHSLCLWESFILYLFFTSEELEVNNTTQNGQLHQYNNAQQQLVCHKPSRHSPKNFSASG